jgi:hypothetical protein
LTNCKFIAKYWNYERRGQYVDYNCDSKDKDILPSGFCIFHDENYLKEDKNNREEHEKTVRDKLMDKVHNNSVNEKEALLCIGYHVPDITIKANFSKPVYFTKCEFQGITDFSDSRFFGNAYFSSAKFSERVNFDKAIFSGIAIFNSAIFSEEADFSRAEFSEEAYFN